MNYKHGRFKRLFAMFLVLVMLATSGNGYSMQVLAQESQDVTGQGETALSDADVSEGEDSTEQSETKTPESAGETVPAETQGQTQQSAGETQGSTQQSTEETQGQTQQSAGETQESTQQSAGETQESTQQSTVQTEAPANNGIMLMNETSDRTFELEAYLDNEAGKTSKEILSGDSFIYNIGYTVPPLSSGESFTGVTISIDLSAFKGQLTVVSDPDGIGGLDVVGEDVIGAVYRPNTGMLNITLSQQLVTGTGRRISIRFDTSNFNWEDGKEIRLEPTLTGSTDKGSDVTGSLEAGKEATVTVKADDGWQVEKSVGTVTSDDDYYYVPYTIKLQNTRGDGTAADTDRMGRLDMTDFELEDILPLPDNGQVNGQGQHTGYPNGGAAAEVVNVTMNGAALTEGTDYTYTPGDTSIIFHKMGQAADGAYIEAGTPDNTTYTYTVKYPKTPYLSPANATKAEEYWLENTAKLTYTLLGEAEKSDEDTADIVLGEKAPEGAFNNLTVEKVVSIGGQEYAFDEDLYGAVTFGLYSDEACTKVANNYIGTRPAGTPQNIGANGQATFFQLAAGTYYLKETAMGSGLSNDDPVVKVILSEDGTVTLGEGETTAELENGRVKVTNQADAYGNLEFYKYGKDAEGKTDPLAGAEFTLTSEADEAAVYTAVSQKDGRVFFEGIPEGEYILKETSVSNDEYTVNSEEIKVTVNGNAMNYPEGLPNPDKIPSGGQAPVYENVSPKGKFKFQKVDSEDNNISLTGAAFRLYGPFAQETAQIPEGSVPVQKDGSDYILTSQEVPVTSMALEAGWYLLEEISSPEGYAVMGDGLTPVQVAANSVTEETYLIKNVKKIPLTINKVGTIQSDSGAVVNTEQLAGAVFEIYDTKAQGAEPIATVETYLDGTGVSVSGVLNADGTLDKSPLYLAPGTYYYKEVKAPEGYEVANSDLQEFTLSADHTTVKVTNSADFGQILITKVDSKDADKGLGGAVFGVYKDNDCQDPLMDGENPVTVTTAADGTGSVRVPASSDGTGTTYYLKEIKAPDGYALSQDVITVQVEKNQQTQVDPIKNTQLRSIKIVKEDSLNDARLSGAIFDVWGPFDDEVEVSEGDKFTQSDETYIDSYTTGTDGTVTISGLEPGKWYYIKETAAPEGYEIHNEPRETQKCVQTTASDDDLSVEVTFKNDRQGKIVIDKVTTMDSENGQNKPYAGVTFKLYYAIPGASGKWIINGDEDKPIAQGTTDENGSLVFDNLTPWKDYLLVEVLPEGDENAYETKNVHVYVSAGDNQEGEKYPEKNITKITNKAIKGKLELDKVSSTDPTDHIMATFEIYKAGQDGEPDGEAVAEITTTGTTETTLSGWLDEGNYVLVETEVTGNYVLNDEPVQFTIEAGKTTSLTGDKALKNDPQGKLTFNKVASFDIAGGNGETVEYDLTGSKLQLYKKTGNDPETDITADNYNSPVDTLDMTNSATATSKALDPGDYWIVETVFPEDYHAGTGSEVHELTLTIDGKEQTVWVVGSCTVVAGKTDAGPVEVKNYTDKGKLRINKWDYNDKDRPLNKAKFELYKVVNPGDEGYEDAIAGPNGAKVVLVQGSSSTDAGGDILESGTHGDGSALSADLEPGTYYIKEVFTDNPNHELYDPEGNEWAGPNWYPYGGEWSGEITIVEGSETIVDFYNFQMVGPGKKTDSISEQPVSGAVFAAFTSSEVAENFVGYVRSQNVSINSANKAQLQENLEKSDFRAQHGIADVSTPSDASGKFEFYALQPGGTYYIVEAVPPDGYALNETVFTVEVADNGDGFKTVMGTTQPLTVEDTPLGRLSVKKITKLMGEEYTVDGVGFEVFEAVTADASTPESEIYAADDGTKYKKATKNPIAAGNTENGIYTSILLEPGFYIVEETKESVEKVGIVGWPDDSSKTYRVIEVKAGSTTNDGSDATFENPAAYGKFLLQKVDQNKQQTIIATFDLFMEDQDGTWKVVDTFTTNPS